MAHEEPAQEQAACGSYCRQPLAFLSWLPGAWLFLPEEPPAERPSDVIVELEAQRLRAERAGALCATPGCRNRSWNGRPGEYCCRACGQRNEEGGEPGLPVVEDAKRCVQCGRPALFGEFCSARCEQAAAKPAEEETPAEKDVKPSAHAHQTVLMTRLDGQRTSVIAFSVGGKEAWDRYFHSEFLSLAEDVGEGALHIAPPGNKARKKVFRTAEAAFAALRFWEQADVFQSCATSEEVEAICSAIRRDRKQIVYDDHGGYGDEWSAMMAVLKAKFKKDSRHSQRLEETGSAFLLCHSDEAKEPDAWTDRPGGKGSNRLGMLLMLLRDAHRNREDWTVMIKSAVHVETGVAHDAESAAHWKRMVMQTASCVNRFMNRPGSG